MSEKPYYLAYEERYRKVYAAGVDRWGHTPDDKVLLTTLTQWVEKNELRGKRIIEFACGEGAIAEILSGLGCIYHGVDIAPSAVARTRQALKGCLDATVSQLDMVKQVPEGTYDAALDAMGLHMLVVDGDRRRYLRNAFGCLKEGAPMLFFRQLYRLDAADMEVDSIEEWQRITGENYDKPMVRTVVADKTEHEVRIPLVPGRARSRQGYERELIRAGFTVDAFVEMEINKQCPHSASIYVHKTKEGG